MPSRLTNAVALAPAFPAAGALAIGALAVRRVPRERTVRRIAQLSLWLSLACVGAALAGWIAAGLAPITVDLGRYFHSGEYGFPLVFRADGLGLSLGLLAAVLTLATGRFSVGYLHREPGFLRFYLLVLVFSAGMFLLVLAGSFDLLFAGWEMVGLTSVLLVGFFQERPGPVRASVRVLVTYRLCDVGLLLAAAALHVTAHSTEFARVFPAAASLPLWLLGAGLLLAAMGKAAQLPMSGWLPRAMEGPTASSAVFYGSLSVHAGVYLLLRAWPLLAPCWPVRVGLVVIGGATALLGTASAKARADAKTSLAFATQAQLGMMFVEIGLGLVHLAAVHLIAHALLRYYQFLRTPSALQDVLDKRAALGGAARAMEPPSFAIYSVALERFGIDAVIDRWVVGPVVRLAEWLEAVESGALSWTAEPPHRAEQEPVAKEAHR